jgi:hypothetical protein
MYFTYMSYKFFINVILINYVNEWIILGEIKIFLKEAKINGSKS